jgi:hypothetical protein
VLAVLASIPQPLLHFRADRLSSERMSRLLPCLLLALCLMCAAFCELSALPARVRSRAVSRTSRLAMSTTGTGTPTTSTSKDILYDVPVSNHGARIRLLLKVKGIEDRVDIL